MEDLILRNIFNPGLFTISVGEDNSQENITKRGDFEKQAYEEIFSNIQEDMKKAGHEISYASKIIISQIALNIIFISRIKFELLRKPIIQAKKIIKPLLIRKKDTYSRDSPKDKTFLYDYLSNGEEINPVLSELLPKLQKQINHQLMLLGILPEQQKERYKIEIVEKMKRRLLELKNTDSSYTADALIEKRTS